MKKTSYLGLYPIENVSNPTCSSTLKDSKFPKYLDLNPGGTEADGTSALRVCPYNYCSLNGHWHATLPPLRAFISARRNLLKTHKSFKIKGHPSFRVKDAKKLDTGQEGTAKVPSGLQFSPLIEEAVNDFLVEIYAKPKEQTRDFGNSDGIEDFQILNRMSGTEDNGPSVKRGDKEDEKTGLLEQMDETEIYPDVVLDADIDQKSEISTEEMDALMEFLEYSEYDQRVEVVENHPSLMPQDYTSSETKSEQFLGNYEENVKNVNTDNGSSEGFNDASSVGREIPGADIPSICNDKASEISDSIVEDQSVDVGLQNFKLSPLDSSDENGRDDGLIKEENEAVSSEENFSDSSNHEKSFEDQGEVSEAKEKISKVSDNNSIEIDGIEYVADSTCLLSISESSNEDKSIITARPKFNRALTDASDEPKLRLRITRKNRTEEPEVIKEFNPCSPRFLPLEPDPEAEKVDLRHQMIDDRKNAEEWMLDYALQRAVSKLAPARKKKVELLVEAFETVAPRTRFEEPPRHATSGFDLARPIQACS